MLPEVAVDRFASDENFTAVMADRAALLLRIKPAAAAGLSGRRIHIVRRISVNAFIQSPASDAVWSQMRQRICERRGLSWIGSDRFSQNSAGKIAIERTGLTVPHAADGSGENIAAPRAVSAGRGADDLGRIVPPF